MGSRLTYGLLWLSFSVYAFFLAPPEDTEATFELIRRLVSGDIAGINPLIVAEFNLMGVLPFVYWCLLLVDGYRQKHRQGGSRIPAWPFAGLMMAVGAFALLPYLALRRPLQGIEGIPTPLPWILRFWNSPWTGRALLGITVTLLFYGTNQGDWADFFQQWQSSRFIHVMTLDFVLLTLLLPVVIVEDQVGRVRASGSLLTAVRFMPLLGPLVYLAFRPAIQPFSISTED